MVQPTVIQGLRTGTDSLPIFNPVRASPASRVWRSRVGDITSLEILPITTSYRDRITLEPGKRGSKPCIRGLRITVQDVLQWLASGQSVHDIVADFPQLESEDIEAALAYAADRERHTAWVHEA